MGFLKRLMILYYINLYYITLHYIILYYIILYYIIFIIFIYLFTIDFSGVPFARRSVNNWSQNDERTFALEEVRKAWYIHETLGSDDCDCYAGTEVKLGLTFSGEKPPCLGLVLSTNTSIIGVMGLAMPRFSHEAYKLAKLN